MNDLLGNLKSNIAEVSDYTDSESDESSSDSRQNSVEENRTCKIKRFSFNNN